VVAGDAERGGGRGEAERLVAHFVGGDQEDVDGCASAE
jgi:hypothetical protein